MMAKEFRKKSEEMFTFSISCLESDFIEYCIVGASDEFPNNITSDVDIVMDIPSSKQGFYPLIKSCCMQSDMQLVQHLQHENGAHYYVLWQDGNSPIADRFLKLDMCGDYVRNGKLLLSAKEILEAKRKAVYEKGCEKDFFIAAPEMEFTYYLVKKIDKQHLSNEQAVQLSKVWREAPDAARKKIERFWNEKEVAHISGAAKSGDWTWVQENLERLQKSLHNRTRRFSLTELIAEWRRVWSRIKNPTGLHIVVLGSDGSGKSTVLNGVMKNLEPAFRRRSYFHLFPRNSGAGNNTSITEPHLLKPRNLPASIVKLLLWLYRYWAGWLRRVFPGKIKSTALYFDRYYHDILVDPKRYRYGGPMWLARLVGRFVPKPDIWILLDAPAEVLQSRKQEVPFEETARQRQAYLDLFKGFKNSVVIDASQPLEDVVANTNKAILEFMVKRTEKRLAKYTC